MNKRLIYSFLLLIIIFVSACRGLDNSKYIKITGIAFENAPLKDASISILDATGNRFLSKTNNIGVYSINVKVIEFPLLISVVSEGDVSRCSDNSKLRPICMAALIIGTSNSKIIQANLNPLTDKIVSDIAVSKGFIGPQQWVDSKQIGEISPKDISESFGFMHAGFDASLKELGLKQFQALDPAIMNEDDHNKIQEIFSLLHHNRNYDNNTGSTGHTTLTDFSFRPIVGLTATGSYEAFDLNAARLDYQRVKNAKKRIFIVGDSTSAVYEQLRYPRMGWGQAFAQKINSVEMQVVVGSRAGRSSRDFYNGRWVAQMEGVMQEGDYIFLNHGHNDQNCDSNKPIRGAADVKNLCTYPNASNGQKQFPNGKPELSFQNSLERYIEFAKAKKMKLVVFTPTTRIKNAQGMQTTPVISSHKTKQKNESAYEFVGDYSATIKKTAADNHVPLVDLETASIMFANQQGEPGWKDYWLVVDASVNPFYTASVAGSTQLPDGTHFQKAGAEAMSDIVIHLIKQDLSLKELHTYLP